MCDKRDHRSKETKEQLARERAELKQRAKRLKEKFPNGLKSVYEARENK
jgi:hypothetical protein